MLTSEQLRDKYFKDAEHPYVTYEKLVLSVLKPEHTLMDAGCGRNAPILGKFAGKAQKLVGVDLEAPGDRIGELKIHYIQGDISSIELEDNSVDVVISRAVLEHVHDPQAVFSEIARVLRPGGSFIFLVPNLWDYVSLISIIVPNRFHKTIVAKTEGRAMEDVFPAYYRANTRRKINRLSRDNGFTVRSFRYLGQYPSSFMFNAVLFYMATLYEKLISRFEFLGFLRGWILAEVVLEN